MKEDWKRPEATVEALSADGWFNVRCKLLGFFSDIFS
jgi:hypothetical protein